jgi:lipid-binding SYLF domain-containing protein
MLRVSKLAAVAALAVLAGAAGAHAQTADPAGRATPAQSEARAVLLKADAALQQFRADPKYAAGVASALRLGHAVLIVPDYVRAGLGIGGAGGTGVLMQKDTAGGWTAPRFYDIHAANIGLQIGYQKGDLLLVIANTDTLRDLLSGELTLSADAAVQAGSNGEKADASTTTAFRNTGVVVFMRGSGAYAGATLGGAKISADATLNGAPLAAADAGPLQGTLSRIAGPSAATR